MCLASGAEGCFMLVRGSPRKVGYEREKMHASASGTLWIQPKAVPCDRRDLLGFISSQGMFCKQQLRSKSRKDQSRFHYFNGFLHLIFHFSASFARVLPSLHPISALPAARPWVRMLQSSCFRLVGSTKLHPQTWSNIGLF